MKLNGAEILVETLIAHGVTDVFGFPGGTVINLYDALYDYQDQITHYLTCHEQGAAHAADGYARATGKTGVVIATSGPGATNLVTGIATAYLDSTPMVAITGNVASNLIGKDSFQEVDIVGITMPVTKHNYMVKHIEELEEIVREAFQIARSGRPGPVLIDIPKDVQQARCEFHGGKPKPLLPIASVREEALAAAAEMIDASERPFVYAGGGLISCSAGEALRVFAERIDAPVGLSIMGLTALDSRHPLKHGLTGMHGHYVASKMNADADLIIGIGVRFSDRATGSTSKYQEKTKIIHIDIDGAEIDKNIDSVISLVGDAAEILPRLTELVKRRENPTWIAQAELHRQEAKRLLAHEGEAQREQEQQSLLQQDEQQLLGQEGERRLEQRAPGTGFTPQSIIHMVRGFTTDDTVISTDVGQHQMWVAQEYDFCVPRTLLTSGGLGTMGFGMGAAIGASVARGSARTVLFTGDGSFHMNMNEFVTAVTYGLPIVVVIFNNGSLGMVRQWQNLFFNQRYSNTTLKRKTDYPKLAEAFGGVGYRATSLDELQAALDAAFAYDGPVMIECLIDINEQVFPIIPAGGSFDDMIVK
ncbi:MAG: thiamine pyrophosphate-binding protein [Coriobacteriaceae bacterium]|nr:thiamine pyrophosphate-binding protein [Coriobacteriaceae bacterium]